MSDKVIKIENVYKEYRLGVIGGGTLKGDLQSLMAKLHGKEDPNLRIGQKSAPKNERFLALKDVSFSVNKGDAVGIIGHNGAGKSTLLKLLARVTAPTKGTISYKGRIASMLEVGTGFHPELTGRENVYLNGAILGMSKVEITKKFDEIVDFAEMEQFIDTPVKRYSSGMYVKLAFAVAAHLDSDILIMDEVLAVGDMKFQQKCLGKMGDAADREGRTVLYVSHNMNTIRQLCNRCVVLDHGCVIFDGDTENGIQKYNGVNALEEKTHYDFKDCKRESYLPVIRKAEMMSLDLLNKEHPIYTQGQTLEFDLKIHCYKTCEHIGLRAEFRNMSDTPVMTVLTSDDDFIRLDNDSDVVLNARINIDMLTTGKYKILLVLYDANEFGTNTDIDCLNPAFVIEKQNDILIHWNCKSWGNIYSGNIMIKEYEK
ncbi:MAG: ABC transporter ATP-binding protein [Oscillospiraceae bacterium]|nr:ABC transporter ATP-binding protein [Oscillospiraceae bacterium]